jgi:hypothetical protein
MHNIDDNITVVDLYQAPATNVLGGTLPDSGTITGAAVDTHGEARKVYCLLSVLHVLGSNTLTVVVQESSDNSTYTTLSSFDAKTGTSSVAVDLTPTKRYIRAYATLGATGTAYVVWKLQGLFYNERYRPSNVA